MCRPCGQPQLYTNLGMWSSYKKQRVSHWSETPGITVHSRGERRDTQVSFRVSLEDGALYKKWAGCRGNQDDPGTLPSTQLWPCGRAVPWLRVVRSLQHLKSGRADHRGSSLCVFTEQVWKGPSYYYSRAMSQVFKPLCF